MKNNLFLLAMCIGLSSQAQWSTTSCTGTDMINTNTGGRVGINECPGTSIYKQYDYLTIGGRLRIAQTSPANTWHGHGGAVMGMDPDSALVIVSGRGGLYLNGDINGLDVNCIALNPNGYVGIGTTAPAEKLTVDGNVAPYYDNSYTCGTSGNRWSAVWATNGMIQTSDARFKADVKKLNYGLAEVLQLNPVSYTWKNGHGETHLGLIAQELQTVIKEVVVQGQDRNKNLGVSYSELIPVLIHAIQEQQKQIDELKKMNLSTSIVTANNSASFALEQNTPNPFSHETVISYSISQKTAKADLLVYDLSGKQINSFPITEMGVGSVTVNAEKLVPGIYIYSIMADGKLIDSKKMVVSEK